mmetsp:Transcript_27999/g.85886  ORF Transcript_27999/g.85886 Transcript_27999/m.85886 type:complete len:98 (+) Transcript_27999:1989-2282(+)
MMTYAPRWRPLLAAHHHNPILGSFSTTTTTCPPPSSSSSSIDLPSRSSSSSLPVNLLTSPSLILPMMIHNCSSSSFHAAAGVSYYSFAHRLDEAAEL